MRCAGFLPFSAIYIELHYIFSSIWGHKVRGLGTEWLGVRSATTGPVFLLSPRMVA